MSPSIAARLRNYLHGRRRQRKGHRREKEMRTAMNRKEWSMFFMAWLVALSMAACTEGDHSFVVDQPTPAASADANMGSEMALDKFPPKPLLADHVTPEHERPDHEPCDHDPHDHERAEPHESGHDHAPPEAKWPDMPPDQNETGDFPDLPTDPKEPPPGINR